VYRSPAQIIIVTDSQDALHLAVQMLLKPGDSV